MATTFEGRGTGSLPLGDGVGGHTRRALAGIYAMAALAGCSRIDPRSPSRIIFLIPWAFALLMSAWVIEDAGRRGRPIPLLGRSWYLTFCGVLLPCYVVSSRRWRGVGWLAVHAFFTVSTIVLVEVVGRLAVFGLEGFGVDAL